MLQLGQIDSGQTRTKLGVNHCQLGVGDVNHVGQQVAAIGRVDRHIDRADIAQPKEYQRVLTPSGTPHQHVVALLYAQLLEAKARADHPLAELCIGPFFVIIVELEEDLVRLLSDPAINQIPANHLIPRRDAWVGGFWRMRTIGNMDQWDCYSAARRVNSVSAFAPPSGSPSNTKPA